jgi:hypothetical protein
MVIMAQQGKIIRLAKKVRPHAMRALYLVFILSFLLPYVEVTGCSTKIITTYRGYQLISKEPGIVVLYLISICIFMAFFVFSFYKKEASTALNAFAAAWRAIMAAVAGFIVGNLPGIQFLFDDVLMLIGQFLGLVCAAAVFIDGMAIAVRNYSVLLKNRDAGAGAGQTHAKALARLHAGVIIFSLALVPAYAIRMLDEIGDALLLFMLLSLPFVLSQCIVLEGVQRGEAWTRKWAVVVPILMAGILVLIVLGYL